MDERSESEPQLPAGEAGGKVEESDAGPWRRLVLAGVMGTSLSAIFVRLSEAAPSTVGFFRAGYALPVLALLAWRSPHVGRSTRMRLAALMAGLLFGLDLVFWHRAIRDVGAGLATVLGNTQVFFVAIAAWLFYGERPRRAVWIGLPIVFLGVIGTSGLGRLDAYGSAPERGVLFGIATAVCYAGFILIYRKATATGGAARCLLDATAGVFLTMWISGLIDGEISYEVTWPAHGWLIALALISHVFGWLTISKGLPHLPALEGSVLLLAQPALTVLFGVWWLGESLSLVQLASVGFVVTGIAIVSLLDR